MQFGVAARLSTMLIASGLLLIAAPGDAVGKNSRHHGRRHAREHNLVQVAQASGFHTFVKAVNASGLASTLSHGGPYTVFAPDDAAFAKLGKKELDDLMANKKSLREVVSYNIVKGKYDAASLQRPQTLKTLAGQNLVVNFKDKVEVAGALVTKPDLKAGNGLIHGVDDVSLPSDVR
jgi:uncharacterized surface protein with fasciclin (FAS1) repeats